MDWSDVGEIAGKAAPLVGTLLGGPAGGAIGGLVASAFGVENEPDKVAQAIQGDPEAAAKLRRIEAEHEAELRRMSLEAETNRLAEVNKTMRTELGSDDAYVRRARPTFLYVVAFSVAAQVAVALLVILWRPDQVQTLPSLYSALAAPLSTAAAMCGVYLKKRSDDKALKAGHAPPKGLIQTMLGK